ncbi:glycosyltransferase family 2 protein [Methyloceanibacter caenitepidi]|uniref:Glycosyltransferase 2-like domain-containing protein n=1 Tax=Methyloceanibacter caenitepidi TaxID=1384459 RepID=A0A0A8JY49_9HYPH|nr:glycosyltransferase family 2 protein [Methyloceanibacter caenitepidi]BAQ15723.1 hypothetical protein GL4_0253 [Methyloceanibacter caenitepidi]
MSKVHVIIPTHNRQALAERCLERVFAQTAMNSMTVTVVDDGSTDGTAAMLAEKFPAAGVIEGDGNLWWTGAVAKALDTLRPDFARGDFFLLVNDDTLLGADTVEALVRISEQSGRAGVAPIAVDAASGHAISTGWAPGSGPVLNDLEKLHAAMAENGGLYPVQTLFGRCSLFPVEILDRVGNYDAALFPHYYGDADFCLRAGKEGFRFFVTDAASIEVVEEQAATGVHFTFRQGPQDFPAVLENMTSIRSIENVPIAWHYMRRHFPGRAGANTASIAWRSLRQWRPIYNALGLEPLPQRGAPAQPQNGVAAPSKDAKLPRRVVRLGRKLLAPVFEVVFFLCYYIARAAYRLVRWVRQR